MLAVVDQHRVRKAYYVEKKSIREIARDEGHSRTTVKKAVQQEEPFRYQRTKAVPGPVLGVGAKK